MPASLNIFRERSKSEAHLSGISIFSGYTIWDIPACIRDLAHLVHGGQVMYAVHSLSDIPIRAACIIAFSSAWHMRGYFISRLFNLSSLSSIPLGSPLKPVLLISRSGPTTTHPTWVEGSLLHDAICFASSKNLTSHLVISAYSVKGPYRYLRIPYSFTNPTFTDSFSGLTMFSSVEYHL